MVWPYIKTIRDISTIQSFFHKSIQSRTSTPLVPSIFKGALSTKITFLPPYQLRLFAFDACLICKQAVTHCHPLGVPRFLLSILPPFVLARRRFSAIDPTINFSIFFVQDDQLVSFELYLIIRKGVVLKKTFFLEYDGQLSQGYNGF